MSDAELVGQLRADVAALRARIVTLADKVTDMLTLYDQVQRARAAVSWQVLRTTGDMREVLVRCVTHKVELEAERITQAAVGD